MHKAVLLLGVTWIFLLYTYTQNDLYNQMLLKNKLQQAVNQAAHDASLQINVDLKSDGEIVFDRAKAHEAIIASFQYNLNLNDDLTPKEKSFLRHRLEITTEDYLDEQVITFPYLYQKRGFQALIHEPSIVLTVRTASYGFSPFSFHGDMYAFTVVNYSGF